MRYLLLPIALVFFCAKTCLAQTINQENCLSAITMYCTMCHSTERICKGLKTFDAKGWTMVLKKMGEESDDVDQGVQDMVHSCLTIMKPGDSLVCKGGR